MRYSAWLIRIVLSATLVGCATAEKDSDLIKATVPSGCTQVATVTSSGFSLIPPIAKSIARSMVVSRAEEFGANAVVIEKQSGTFQVDINALAYKCPKQR